MNGKKTLVLASAIALLLVGCAKNKPAAATQSKAAAIAKNSTGGGNGAAPTAAPAVPADKLAGDWQLAIPRQDQQEASITFTDETHVTIKAGNDLSGDYVVHGSYLLVLSNDEDQRPLAWRINSPDSLTVVRSTNGSDYTGVTLVRAAASETASTEADAFEGEAMTDADADADGFEGDAPMTEDEEASADTDELLE